MSGVLRPFDRPSASEAEVSIPAGATDQELIQAYGHWSNVDVTVSGPEPGGGDGASGGWQSGSGLGIDLTLWGVRNGTRFILARSNTKRVPGRFDGSRFEALVFAVRGHPCDGFLVTANTPTANAGNPVPRGYVRAECWGSESTPVEAGELPLDSSAVQTGLPREQAFCMVYNPGTGLWDRMTQPGGVASAVANVGDTIDVSTPTPAPYTIAVEYFSFGTTVVPVFAHALGTSIPLSLGAPSAACAYTYNPGTTTWNPVPEANQNNVPTVTGVPQGQPRFTYQAGGFGALATGQNVGAQCSENGALLVRQQPSSEPSTGWTHTSGASNTARYKNGKGVCRKVTCKLDGGVPTGLYFVMVYDAAGAAVVAGAVTPICQPRPVNHVLANVDYIEIDFGECGVGFTLGLCVSISSTDFVTTVPTFTPPGGGTGTATSVVVGATYR